jgi:hypothetical protein
MVRITAKTIKQNSLQDITEFWTGLDNLPEVYKNLFHPKELQFVKEDDIIVKAYAIRLVDGNIYVLWQCPMCKFDVHNKKLSGYNFTPHIIGKSICENNHTNTWILLPSDTPVINCPI